MLNKVPAVFAGKARRCSGAKAAGKRYEKKALEMLERTFPGLVWAGPWFAWGERGKGGYQVCQPDALIFDLEAGHITIVEVKLRHTEAAWWQLERKYRPIVQAAFPAWEIFTVEVMKWFDPEIKLPGPSTHLKFLGNPAPNITGLYHYDERFD